MVDLRDSRRRRHPLSAWLIILGLLGCDAFDNPTEYEIEADRLARIEEERQERERDLIDRQIEEAETKTDSLEQTGEDG